LAELDLADDDPFATVILSTGLSVDLEGGEEAVHAGLLETLKMEGALFNRGIVCELKDNGQDCLSCASYIADREDRRSRLCRLGRDQRTLEVRGKELSAARTAPYRELAEEFIEMSQLGAEYAELASVGG
jgi:hypothetical protein